MMKIKRNYQCGLCGKKKMGLTKRPNCTKCNRLMEVRFTG